MRALIVIENDDKGVVTDSKFYLIAEDKEQAIKFESNVSKRLQETLLYYIKSSFNKYKEKNYEEK